MASTLPFGSAFFSSQQGWFHFCSPTQHSNFPKITWETQPMHVKRLGTAFWKLKEGGDETTLNWLSYFLTYILESESCSVMSNSLPPHELYDIWSMEFSRQEYWSGLPFPFLGDLPNPGIKPQSPALQADCLTSWATGEEKYTIFHGILKSPNLSITLILFYFPLQLSLCNRLQNFHIWYVSLPKSLASPTRMLIPQRQRFGLMVQWWRLRTSTAGHMGLIPGQGAKIPQAVQSRRQFCGIKQWMNKWVHGQVWGYSVEGTKEAQCSHVSWLWSSQKRQRQRWLSLQVGN